MTGSEFFNSRPFMRYWQATAVSGLGSYVTLFVLQVLVVVTLDGSTTEVGWLNAARWLPFLGLGLAVGRSAGRGRQRGHDPGLRATR